MMENKFTPGKWIAEIEPYDPNRKYGFDIKGTTDPDKYEWIATVNQQFEGYENGVANARLIAEAPAMYELLEKFCVECNKHNLEFFAPEYEEAMTIFQRINKE
jgi:hypothetical protein